MVDIRTKNILIRADGNARIGAGHLMRCLTIAQVIKEREQVCFVCADEESAELARTKGFEAVVLHTDYSEPESELSIWERLFADVDKAECLNEKQKRVILVDSYYVTNSYLEGLGYYGEVVLLDDMGKQAWNVSKLINYNVFASQDMYSAFEGVYPTEYFLGPKYVPVRGEFCDRSYAVRELAKDIMITTGGGDYDNIAGRILERIWDESCTYHVVTGRFNPHYAELCEKAHFRENIHIYHDVKDMATLMESCDLAVTAGGTTVYELSVIGVPYVCFSYAENQEKLAEYVGEHSVAGFGGAYHKNAEDALEKIASQIEELKRDKELRKKYSCAERSLVDGEGAERIARLLEP